MRAVTVRLDIAALGTIRLPHGILSLSQIALCGDLL